MSRVRRINWAVTTSCIAAAMLTGCATTPKTSSGRDLIRVTTVRYPFPGDTMPTLGWGTGPRVAPSPLAGAQCTVSNDRGSWSVTTPASIEVERSGRPFHVSCTLEGFRETDWDVECVSPRAEAAAVGSLIGIPAGAAAGYGAALALAGPAAIVAAVTAPIIVGGAAGHALAKPDTVSCTLMVPMTPGS